MSLSDSFIQSILEKVNSPDVIGVGIVGSYARGQESKYSDVDVDIYVNKMPENEYEQFTAHYWNGKLVSFSHTVLEEERAALTDPKRAIWAVPGLRGMKILLDKDGSLEAPQQAAYAFEWSPLQSAADKFAGEEVVFCAEEIHKILNGLARGHESTVLYSVWGLVKNLLEAVAVQRGIMIVSENRYFDLIQDSVGRESKWVSAFRKAWGLDPNASQYQSRGAAALTLYRLSAAMFDEYIPDKHRDVVNNTLRLIKEAGNA
ncbi:MAG TPA: nucleotidyltransferase domain-containing protein [Anaerolineales bacterium]|nr:nucleotidyltransferase domain-containing protein [Anaerolineales bacterium]HNQ95988.1 nucleotidyltransferase domain-containing protein [Anaerolineales bacterium]HNS62158.1 nucleotidyltransferase domain-containing protein [Anaerolineales bacterium]